MPSMFWLQAKHDYESTAFNAITPESWYVTHIKQVADSELHNLMTYASGD